MDNITAISTDAAPAIMLPIDWAWCPADSCPFFVVSLALSLLLGITEVAGAYQDKPHAARAVFNRWAMPYYALYLLLTYLIGRILLEHDMIVANWTSAVVVGLLGPTLFKTQIKLFKPLGGGEGLNANLEKILQGVQSFCLSQINISLSRRRIDLKIAITAMDELRLTTLVEALYGDTRFQKDIKPLIDERHEENPDSVRALLVELIERESPELLDKLNRDHTNNPPDQG